jgi:predicted nucleic acid-binding protein
VAYLIDTNIAIHARDSNASVLDKIAEHDGSVSLSALTLAELQPGMHRTSANASLRRARLDVMLRYIPVLPFDAAAARAYGRIIAQCGWVRNRDLDRKRMIAAHAISSQSVLVTDNVDDFRDIPGLALENWLARP